MVIMKAFFAALIVLLLYSLPAVAQTQLPSRTPTKEVVSSIEREALIALYRATDGNHWKGHAGWLGDVGTECEWQGVTCTPDSEGSMVVEALDVGDNNLTGTIPESLGRLTHVEWLYIYGNHLKGVLPEALIQRWLSGTLEISAEEPLLTDVSTIDFESASSSILCARHRVLMRADRSVTVFTERCRNATRRDRKTYCEIKNGRLWRGEFSKMAWVLQKNSFFTLQHEYWRNITEATFESTRVERGGKEYEVVNYAAAGPLDLWDIQRAIEGVAGGAEWEKTSTRSQCPKWSEQGH
jgi:hypothetical protein